MSLPLNYKMELLHSAYVHAVVASAGTTCDPPPRKDLGIDLRVIDMRHNEQIGHYDAGVAFNCQLKATTNCEVRDDCVVYDMDARAYNKLVNWNGIGFAILIVFRLPKNEQEWFNLSEDILCMKHCCYWTQLKGEKSTNSSSVRIKIPRDQLFDTQTVIELIERARQDKRHG